MHRLRFVSAVLHKLTRAPGQLERGSENGGAPEKARDARSGCLVGSFPSGEVEMFGAG